MGGMGSRALALSQGSSRPRSKGRWSCRVAVCPLMALAVHPGAWREFRGIGANPEKWRRGQAGISLRVTLTLEQVSGSPWPLMWPDVPELVLSSVSSFFAHSGLSVFVLVSGGSCDNTLRWEWGRHPRPVRGGNQGASGPALPRSLLGRVPPTLQGLGLRPASAVTRPSLPA